MASPNATFTELVTTTFRNHKSKVADNISNNNALYRRQMDNGRYRREDGGLTIVCPLDYNENGTYQRYSGYDFLNVQQSDVLTAAEYTWQQIAMNIVSSGRELRINKGKSKIISLAKSKMRNAMRTFANNFSFDMYGDGTLPNQILGLQALVSDAGTGTVGGINSSNWPFWLSTVQSAAAPLQGGGSVTVSATTIENDIMLPLWMELTRGDDHPDIIISSNDWFRFYEASQVAIKRYMTSERAKGGFMSLAYKNADVIFDGGSGIPTAHMYFLNTDYLEMVVHEDADLEVQDDMKPTNQDAAIVSIIWMGNNTCSNRALQGVAKA